MKNKRIPIQEAIDSGAWLEATFPEIDDFRVQNRTTTLVFRFKPKKLEKINLGGIIDDPNVETSSRKSLEFLLKFGSDANIWKLDLEIVNMEQYELRSDLFGELLCIQDERDNEFRNCKDHYLTLDSYYSETSGLRNFFCSELPPKVKKSGSFCFELPEFFEQLFITAKNGTIKEC